MRRFAYRLALALGRWDVDALLAEMPRSALLEWSAYHHLEPWGEDRADARTAIVASLIYNANRRRGSPARRPQDFFAYQEPRAPMSKAKIQAFKLRMREAIRGNADKSIGSPEG